MDRMERYVKFGLAEAVNMEAFWHLCEAHISLSMAWSPTFANKLTHYPADVYALNGFRRKETAKQEVLDGKCAVDHLLHAEVYKFLAELARGDLDRAWQEAADVVAVLWRALEMLEAKTKEEGDGHAR
ncbi:MAG: hypothetical protein ACI4RT_03780 [Candidatus Spyradenecus sp.]